MKTSLLFSLAILSLLFSACSETIIENPEDNELFYKLVGSYHDDHILSASLVKDNELLLTGYTTDQFDDKRLFVSKIDAYGMMDWTTASSEKTNSRLFDGLYLSNADQYVCFACEYLVEDTIQLSVMYFNTEGVVEDSISYQLEGDEIESAKIIEAADQSLSVLIQYVKGTDNYLSTYKVADDLSLVSEQILPMEFHDGIKVSELHSDAHYLTSSVTEATGERKLWVAKLKAGFIEWWTVTDYEGQWLTGDDILIRNSRIMVLSNIHVDEDNFKGALITKISLSGEVVEQSEFDLGYDKETGYVVSVDTDNEGNLLFVSNVSTDTGTTNNSQDIVYSLTDDSGQVIVSSSYGSHGLLNDKGNEVTRVFYLPNENMSLIIGHMDLINNIDICLLKVDHSGQWIIP